MVSVVYSFASEHRVLTCSEWSATRFILECTMLCNIIEIQSSWTVVLVGITIDALKRKNTKQKKKKKHKFSNKMEKLKTNNFNCFPQKLKIVETNNIHCIKVLKHKIKLKKILNEFESC